MNSTMHPDTQRDAHTNTHREKTGEGLSCMQTNRQKKEIRRSKLLSLSLTLSHTQKHQRN